MQTVGEKVCLRLLNTETVSIVAQVEGGERLVGGYNLTNRAEHAEDYASSLRCLSICFAVSGCTTV